MILEMEMQGVLRELDHDYKNHDLKLVIADIYEERGDLPRAEAWRELHRLGRFPRVTTTAAYWWYAVGLYPGDEAKTHVLDKEINSIPTPPYYVLSSHKSRKDHHCHYFYSAREAFLAAVEGYILWKS